MRYHNLESLEVYTLAVAFSNDIWNIVIAWNKLAQDTIGKQVIRSTDSISANIAEGYGRYHYKENKNFCYYSRGSILETKDWLSKSKSSLPITDTQHDILLEKLQNIHHKLNAYMKFIGKANKTS